MIFWLAIVPLMAFYLACWVAQRRIERKCRDAVEEFLNRDE